MHIKCIFNWHKLLAWGSFHMSEYLSSYHDMTIDYCNIQGESKKSGISKIMGITSLKYIRKGHIGGVLENSGYLLPDGH